MEASVPCGHGHTSDATAGAKQRPAAAAATGGYGLDRPLQRQPYAISRAIAGQLQPAHGVAGAIAAALEQSQQLRRTRGPLLTVSSLMFTNLTSHFHSNHSRRLLAVAIHVQQQTLQAVGRRGNTIRTALCPFLFRDMCRNLGSNGGIRRAEL